MNYGAKNYQFSVKRARMKAYLCFTWCAQGLSPQDLEILQIFNISLI